MEKGLKLAEQYIFWRQGNNHPEGYTEAEHLLRWADREPFPISSYNELIDVAFFLKDTEFAIGAGALPTPEDFDCRCTANMAAARFRYWHEKTGFSGKSDLANLFDWLEMDNGAAYVKTYDRFCAVAKLLNKKNYFVEIPSGEDFSCRATVKMTVDRYLDWRESSTDLPVQSETYHLYDWVYSNPWAREAIPDRERLVEVARKINATGKKIALPDSQLEYELNREAARLRLAARQQQKVGMIWKSDDRTDADERTWDLAEREVQAGNEVYSKPTRSSEPKNASAGSSAKTKPSDNIVMPGEEAGLEPLNLSDKKSANATLENADSDTPSRTIVIRPGAEPVRPAQQGDKRYGIVTYDKRTGKEVISYDMR